MTQTTPQVVQQMRHLALGAGRLIMEVFNSEDFQVDHKDDDSPVTIADKRADQFIYEGLRVAFPDVHIVTEEQESSHVKAPDRFFIVDPLDGTKEFVNRRSEFTVNIALIENRVPILGVIFAPAIARLFYTVSEDHAVEELGFLDTETPSEFQRLRVSEPDNEALRIVGSKSHRNPDTVNYINRYRWSENVPAGSSLKFCLMAAGEADFYPRIGPTMEWDTAAGQAILLAAGGQVLDLETGKDLHYGKPRFRNPNFIARAPGVTLR